MTSYKHTQIGYLMLVFMFVIFILFAWVQITARAEPPSVDSGTNFFVTAVMATVLFILASFSTLTVSVDEQFLHIRFGWGIFSKKFLISDITTVKTVKNSWYHGWGIHFWFWPSMWIFNVSGIDAVEIAMRNGKIYRIGTNDPNKLETVLKHVTFSR